MLYVNKNVKSTLKITAMGTFSYNVQQTFYF